MQVLTQALSDIEVRLVPYDRDAVFNSLTGAYSTPEPEVPEALLAARTEVQSAQAEWDATQRRWGILRDTLQQINSTLEELERTDARYVILFAEYNDFDSEYASVEREVEAAFERFDSLQQGTIRASDSVRILQDNWADDAYADIGVVFGAKASESGLDLAVDTTDASGVARQNLQVSPGQ